MPKLFRFGSLVMLFVLAGCRDNAPDMFGSGPEAQVVRQRLIERTPESIVAYVRSFVGYWVNEDCHILSKDGEEEFKAQLLAASMNLEIALVARGLKHDEAKEQIRYSVFEAKQYAKENYRSCDKKSRAIVKAAPVDARCINSYLTASSNNSCFKAKLKTKI